MDIGHITPEPKQLATILSNTQTGLLVSGRPWCDYISYSERIIYEEMVI